MALNVLYANFDHESINYPGISIFSLKGKKKKKEKLKLVALELWENLSENSLKSQF